MKKYLLLYFLMAVFTACGDTGDPISPPGGNPVEENPVTETPDGNDFWVTTTEEWNAALTAISNGGSGTSDNPKAYTITIAPASAFGVPGSTGYTFGNTFNITVTIKGYGRIYLNSQGSLLNIGNTQTVFIDSHSLVFDGLQTGKNNANQDNASPLIFINGSNASIELRSGSIIGNTNTNSIGGGGVLVYGGNFTMTGGTIRDNISSGNRGIGGGVTVRSGNFTMSGGMISYNISNSINNIGGDSGGGGIYVSDGSFTMDGGTISYNSSSSIGGGVSLSSSKAVFTMTGGNISDNSADMFGGGVFGNASSQFKMLGGTVTGNNNQGVYLSSSSLSYVSSGATIFFSGEAYVDNVMLHADSLVKTSHIGILSGWLGRVGILNLSVNSTNMNTALTAWRSDPILAAYVMYGVTDDYILTAADADKFLLGSITTSDNNIWPIGDTHKIELSDNQWYAYLVKK